MKIKEIKLYGFKSFREETKVLLNTGVTAFVGPNGSGKSNIFDALRWVFGEQSMKALRCEKIEDLIYVSSDTNEDANFTEVAVTIDNEDYFPQFGSEFEIKRRFYKSGESEFYLNRVKCRLQDIQALFLNSGALTYSFLELAEVERIVHGNTKEMFDDVAGILKYQERREQTRRRLVATEQDLLRLEDIIGEMQRGLRSLKRQVRQARLYNELRTEYKALKLFIMFNDLKVTLEDVKVIQSKIDAQESNRQVLLNNIKQLEEEREELKKSIENAENEKEENLSQMSQLIGAIDALQNQINEKEEDVRNKTITSEKILTSIKEKEEVVDNNRKRLSEEEEERNKIDARLGEVRSSIKDMREKVDAENEEYFSMEKAHRENEKRISDAASNIVVEQGNIATLKYDRENKEGVLARMAEELAQQNDEMEKYRHNRKELERELSKIVKQQDEADGELKGLHDKMADLEQALNEIEEKLKAHNDSINDCRVMIDMFNRRLQVEGKGEIEKRLGSKVGGMFKDNIDVTEGRESVIDLCLGDLLSFYLLNEYSVDDLMNCPEGRFGFIDMQSATEKSGDVHLPGAIPISDFVKFKAAPEALKRHVENYFFLEDHAKAVDFSRQYPQYGFVTANGLLLRNGTIVVQTGEVGYFKITQSLEEYKGKIESLRNEVIFMTEEKKRMNAEVDEIRQHIDDTRNRLFTINVRKSEISLKLQDATKEYDRRETELAIVKEDRETITADIESITSRIEEAERHIKKLEAEKADMIEENLQLLESMKRKKQEIDTAVAEMNTVATEEAVLEGKNESLARSIAQIESEISAAETDIQKLREQMLPADIGDLKDSIVALKEELSRKRQERSAQETQLPDQLITEYGKRQGLVYDQLAQKQKDHEVMQDQIMQLKYQLFEKNHRRDDLKHKADEEFGIILDDHVPEEEMPDADSRLTEVRGRIEKLGEVNPLSLQAYEDEKKRLDEFLGQRDDIIAAKKNLLKSIEELDQRARDRFNEVFAHVREQFNFVFSNFFEDGQADLILTDPENPLASKVEIVVRMMGRKLKTINQLSGGQKTLLAISLLLAFYLVKPAPFCILDEIDAPLDDINVVRFNKFLRDLSQRTQVVIITHNRATMEYADYLYGLTMEKPRESKVISARLADLERITALEE
ncbi:MAG: chromosome segregation protein SMC [candidate division WOR-3 bacterium]|nr:MAG: chromosome segregation protein SMC [candidate division WOR-3 bacterium]